MIDVFVCMRENGTEWAAMRGLLWPEETPSDHRTDIERQLGEPERFIAFMAYVEGAPAGFAEASLRFDYVNGCGTSPVVFLEGLYVKEELRRRGVARALSDAVEQWGRDRSCTEFASDALLENVNSHNMHAALGFEETERVVYFRKPVR